MDISDKYPNKSIKGNYQQYLNKITTKGDEFQQLRDELESLIKIWKNSKWWNRWVISHAICVKVWYRWPVIATALTYHKAGIELLNHK